MNHTEWQDQVLGLAAPLGWQHLHVRRTKGRHGWTTSTNREGWPDLFLWNVHRPGFVAIELKVAPDLPRQNQLDVLAELAAAGALVAVAYPEQYDQVVALLHKREPFPPYAGKVGVPLRRR